MFIGSDSMVEHRSQEWIEQTEAKVREVFEIFDKDRGETILQVYHNNI